MDTVVEAANRVDRMRIVGGDLALDFLNTRTGPPRGPTEDDVLGDYADLVAWARHVGSLGDQEAKRLIRRAQRHPSDARSAFDRAIRLRDALDDIFRASANDDQPPAHSVAALRTAQRLSLNVKRVRP